MEHLISVFGVGTGEDTAYDVYHGELIYAITDADWGRECFDDDEFVSREEAMEALDESLCAKTVWAVLFGEAANLTC